MNLDYLKKIPSVRYTNLLVLFLLCSKNVMGFYKQPSGTFGGKNPGAEFLKKTLKQDLKATGATTLDLNTPFKDTLSGLWKRFGGAGNLALAGGVTFFTAALARHLMRSRPQVQRGVGENLIIGADKEEKIIQSLGPGLADNVIELEKQKKHMLGRINAFLSKTIHPLGEMVDEFSELLKEDGSNDDKEKANYATNLLAEKNKKLGELKAKLEALIEVDSSQEPLRNLEEEFKNATKDEEVLEATNDLISRARALFSEIFSKIMGNDPAEQEKIFDKEGSGDQGGRCFIDESPKKVVEKEEGGASGAMAQDRGAQEDLKNGIGESLAKDNKELSFEDVQKNRNNVFQWAQACTDNCLKALAKGAENLVFFFSWSEQYCDGSESNSVSEEVQEIMRFISSGHSLAVNFVQMYNNTTVFLEFLTLVKNFQDHKFPIFCHNAQKNLNFLLNIIRDFSGIYDTKDHEKITREILHQIDLADILLQNFYKIVSSDQKDQGGTDILEKMKEDVERITPTNASLVFVEELMRNTFDVFEKIFEKIRIHIGEGACIWKDHSGRYIFPPIADRNFFGQLSERAENRDPSFKRIMDLWNLFYLNLNNLKENCDYFIFCFSKKLQLEGDYLSNYCAPSDWVSTQKKQLENFWKKLDTLKTAFPMSDAVGKSLQILKIKNFLESILDYAKKIAQRAAIIAEKVNQDMGKNIKTLISYLAQREIEVGTEEGKNFLFTLLAGATEKEIEDGFPLKNSSKVLNDLKISVIGHFLEDETFIKHARKIGTAPLHNLIAPQSPRGLFSFGLFTAPRDFLAAFRAMKKNDWASFSRVLRVFCREKF